MPLRRITMLTLLSLAGAAAAKPGVVVSFQPYLTITRNIAGPHADVSSLVPPGANPHQYEPRPSDLKRVANSRLVVLNGLGLDEWVETLAKNSGTRARLLPVGEALKFEPLEPAGNLDEEHEDDHGHEHDAVDPHIWLDASIMQKAATLIGEELAKIDPANRDAYRQRAAQESRRLRELHEELRKTLAPVRNVPVVTFHGAWGYWSRAYGPKIAAVVEPFPGKEPSVKYVRDVVRLLQQRRARAVFAEPQLPAGPARVIAESAGTTLHVIAPEGSAKTTDYYDMMRENARVFIKALR